MERSWSLTISSPYLNGDRTEPLWTCTPPNTYPKDTYLPITYPLNINPLDTYPLGHIPPGHLPPGHLPPGHLSPRTPPGTYTPEALKCPIWFMHHVLITFCTLKSIYFAGITLVCVASAIKLSGICSFKAG